MIVVAMATAVIGAVPAAAAPPPKPTGKPIASVSVKASSTKGSRSVQDLWCIAYSSPEPQYSASNRTIHYGVWVNCNHGTELTMKIQIFVKPPNRPYEPADDPITDYSVGNTGSAGGVTACFPGGTGLWQARAWITSSTVGNLLPYPAYSTAHSFPCT
jgi:hypothetical protein